MPTVHKILKIVLSSMKRKMDARKLGGCGVHLHVYAEKEEIEKLSHEIVETRGARGGGLIETSIVLHSYCLRYVHLSLVHGV